MVASAIYLTSNAAEVVLFFVPAMGKYIEVSNNKICRVLAWWIQVSSSYFLLNFPTVLAYQAKDLFELTYLRLSVDISACDTV